IDPSSKRSGGSILGDKTRMLQLATHDRAFIRPSPTGDALGGVARKTRQTIPLLEAAGYDPIIVETVGVGQSETMAASMVDFFTLITTPNAGDDLQGIKRGIMELVHAILVNKADGAFEEQAKTARHILVRALELMHPPVPGWKVSVETVSSLREEGIGRYWEMVEAFRGEMVGSGQLAAERRRQARDWMWEMVEEELKRRFITNHQVSALLPGLEQAVIGGAVPPVVAASQLLDAHFGASRNLGAR
ncbi:MAG: methylmalonyl Co-A mutase-associated GTPase MeaB, partial [Magnetococcales bacterium]|nr:methylmalonyl Co-A mutase-associated GTPase MeaB [Magnetococcales bacterium]